MFKEFYNKNYKKLILIPIFLLILSLTLITTKYITTGDIINRDISLKGGITSTIYTEKEFDTAKLEKELSKDLKTDVFVREISDITSKKQLGFIIEIADTNVKDNLKENLEKHLEITLTKENYSIEEVGSTLGESFYQDMLKAILIAFILMGIVVFIAFRSFIPSLAVILSAILDITATLAGINLLNIKISTAGIAAFLLVIGYSIDSDILLTTKVLKRREESDIIDKMISAAKTGLTMTITTITALGVAYLITSSLILKQMFLIILIALIVDTISTYLMNASILKWYYEKKHKIENET